MRLLLESKEWESLGGKCLSHVLSARGDVKVRTYVGGRVEAQRLVGMAFGVSEEVGVVARTCMTQVVGTSVRQGWALGTHEVQSSASHNHIVQTHFAKDERALAENLPQMCIALAEESSVRQG